MIYTEQDLINNLHQHINKLSELGTGSYYLDFEDKYCIAGLSIKPTIDELIGKELPPRLLIAPLGVFLDSIKKLQSIDIQFEPRSLKMELYYIQVLFDNIDDYYIDLDCFKQDLLKCTTLSDVRELLQMLHDKEKYEIY